MNKLVATTRELWAGLAPRLRLQLAVAAAATLLLVWGITLYANWVRYAVLFSRVERDDASSIVSALRDRQIPYRLSEGGTTVHVPTGQVDELRLALAGEGLAPQSAPAAGLSDFAQSMNYRRALERELAQTIQSLDAVQSARVHLAQAADGVPAGEHGEPSASVVVRLRSGRELETGQLRAISHLVASGVEGLDPRNVSVIDGEGRMLSDGGDGGEQMLSGNELEAKRLMERRIESTLISILEPVVGAGRVRTRATVELNLARVERVEETFDPDVALVRSEQKTRSRPRGAGAAEDSQSSETSFELNKTTATIAEPAGTLARQSVAVVVDHAQAPAAGNPPGERTPAARTQEEMTQITDIVRAAIGIDEKRGDVLIVENVPFDETALPGAEETGLDWGLWLRLARYASLPLSVLLLALLVIRPAIAALRAHKVHEATAASEPPTVAQLHARLQADLARGALPVLSGGISPLRRKLIEAAQEDPRAAAMVIKSWLEHNRDRG